jgi:hypothetical protein
VKWRNGSSRHCNEQQVAYQAGTSLISLWTAVLSRITQLIRVSCWCKFVNAVNITTVAPTATNFSHQIADVIMRKLSFCE